MAQSSEAGSHRTSLRDLIVKRSSIKGQVTKFRNFLDKINGSSQVTNMEIAELTIKLGKFEGLSTRFDALQTEIEVLNSDSISVELDERECIENDIVQNIALAKSLIQEYETQIRDDDVERRQSLMKNDLLGFQNQNFKLPQIHISKFDGSYFRWLEFRDTFTSLVHTNDRIADIHKFHYLVSYLEGDASRIISNLEISSANYIEAWNLLCERYNNKRILINHHLDSLFNIHAITRESERALRYLVDHVTKNLRALCSLGQPTDKWDLLVIYMLTSKLDSQTTVKWEEFRNSLKDVPSLDQFKKFLIDRADVLESLNRNKSVNNNNHLQKFTPRSIQNTPQIQAPQNKFISKNERFQNKTFTTVIQRSGAFLCIVCNQNHRIYDCPTFRSLSIKEKMSLVSKYKLCQNCLRQGHPVSECRMGSCRQCNEKHNTLLHESNTSVNCNINETQNESIVAFSQQTPNQVLLSTVMLQVVNPQNQRLETVRALLDSGSQSSFITKSLQQRLNLKCNSIDAINVVGIGNNHCDKIRQSCGGQLRSLDGKYQVGIYFYVMDKLTGDLPKAPIDTKFLKLPKNLQLADPKFNEPAKIEVLLGADIFWDVLESEQHYLGPHYPKLQNSKFGWIIAGPIGTNKLNSIISCNHATISKDIDKMLSKFWEIEELPPKKILSPNDKECEEHFIQNTIRLGTGRFCVKLPFKDSPDCLGDSYTQAKRRFLSLEKRFRNNPELKLQYVEFIREYADMGHLSESSIKVPHPSYFLCHHAVFKEDSETTKIRVVFDGSASTTSGYSLNDILRVGPNLQDSLFSILIRARQYKFILTGDIAKMYRQVKVDENDTNLQLILWREDESQPIRTLRLGTVTYGTASASYLSTRCLWEIGEQCEDETIKRIIQSDFFVDDLITGSNDEGSLKYILNSVSAALNSACFPLRKFKTNSSSLFKDSDINTTEKLTISESSSTLGLGWDPKNDTFNFPVKLNFQDKDVTKRTIMSNSFSIFDPLGLLSPCIIQSKILLQKLWLEGLDWDQPVPDEIGNSWRDICKTLPFISDIQVPRRVICDSPVSIELHSFSDASQSAFGACIYVRSIDESNKVYVSLLCSKSKVAPLKPTTMPRLELCAALLAARLCKDVIDTIKPILTPSRIVHWCDSSIVLCWINNDPRKLKTFVANRIGEIIDITERSSWRYVPTNVNPADLISRGVNATQLCNNEMWWNGPAYLLNDETKWPILKSKQVSELPEVKVNTATVATPTFDFKRFSNFNKLKRIFAYILRFLHNAKSCNKNNKRKGNLSLDELNESFNFICRVSQKQSFGHEYKLMTNDKQLESKSKILSLSPFLDHDTKLIRVGGRLKASDYDYQKKHPVLLDSSHYIVKLYFESEHLRNLHAGPQLLLSTIRESVWPLNGRKLARRVVRQCVACARVRGKTLCPKMGDLPSYRITADFPFKSVGVDYAGPFYILNRKGRGAKIIKCYLCIFVCLRYKCVHLEAVSDLTKEAFIMTFRRFISRRGKPTEVFSDNGRNFVGAAKDINIFIKSNRESLSEFASTEGIKFNFIPAYAPHFGGIWEAGVKSAKFHIKRVMGNTHLTFEEISTLFAQVEAMLNSRPLCPMSSCPTDLLSLSPGHFIIGRPLNALPAPNLTEHKTTSLQRYARLEQIRQHLWQRWQREYISELQNRVKWRTNSKSLEVGDMVLLQEDNVPPLCWRLGRIIRLYPGRDGIVRVADITTTKGCVRRPLVRLCPLPKPEDLLS